MAQADAEFCVKRRRLQIEKAVHGLLSPLGFKKHKTFWTRTLSDTRQFIGLDKRTTSATYRLVFGINVRNVCDDPRATFHRLHLRWLASQFFNQTEREAWVDISKLESSAVDDEDRAAAFARAVKDIVLPTLELVRSVEHIEQFLTAPPAGSWPHASGDRDYIRGRLGFSNGKLPDTRR
jgi:hypothetical protein